MSSIGNNPASFRFENTKADAFGYFDGQKKDRLILTDRNEKVVKIAAEKLDETTGKILFAKQQLQDKNFFTKHLVTKIGETWVKIDIDSASKRLGIAAERIFECAKSNKFTDLLVPTNLFERLSSSFSKLTDIQKLQLAELLINDIIGPIIEGKFSSNIVKNNLMVGFNKLGEIISIKTIVTVINDIDQKKPTSKTMEDSHIRFLNNELLKGILTIKEDETIATALGNIAAKKKELTDIKNRQLKEIEDKTDQLMGLWSRRIQDISNPGKQPLNRDDCKRIVESVVLNQQELVAEASVHPNKTIYKRDIKGVKLPRAVQIDADGSIFIHFNKSKEKDRVIGTGSFKKVRFAVKLNDMQVYAVAKVRVTTQQQLVAQQEEGRFLKLLKGLDGVSQIEKEVLVKGKKGQDKLLLIQPYYNSGDLFTNIDRGFLTPKEKLKITLDLLKGLASIHSKGIIHCDMKPQNVFLSENEQGKLSAFIGDFGLSTLNTDDKKKEMMAGTPSFFSPEYAKATLSHDSEEIKTTTTENLDSWALGTTLLMLYTGTNNPPWLDPLKIVPGRNVLKTIAGITEINPSWLDTVQPEVIKNLIQDLIQINTQLRYSAQEALNKYEDNLKAQIDLLSIKTPPF
jgi:hypothetical protein